MILNRYNLVLCGCKYKNKVLTKIWVGRLLKGRTINQINFFHNRGKIIPNYLYKCWLKKKYTAFNIICGNVGFKRSC